MLKLSHVLDSVMLYSSIDAIPDDTQVTNPNYYPPFKLVDSTVIRRIIEEFGELGDPEEEGMFRPYLPLHVAHWLVPSTM